MKGLEIGPLNTPAGGKTYDLAEMAELLKQYQQFSQVSSQGPCLMVDSAQELLHSNSPQII